MTESTTFCKRLIDYKRILFFQREFATMMYDIMLLENNDFGINTSKKCILLEIKSENYSKCV